MIIHICFFQYTCTYIYVCIYKSGIRCKILHSPECNIIHGNPFSIHGSGVKVLRVPDLDRTVVRAKGRSQTQASKPRSPELRNPKTRNPEIRNPGIHPLPKTPSTQCTKVGSGGAMTLAERAGHKLNGFTDFGTEHGSRQGQNLALTGLFVPNSLHNGPLLTYLTRASPLISEPCLETL
jgi:hypothetical protein